MRAIRRYTVIGANQEKYGKFQGKNENLRKKMEKDSEKFGTFASIGEKSQST